VSIGLIDFSLGW